jgi:hypothetical protein
MRKLVCLLAVLVVTVLAGLPLAAHAAVPGARALGASTSRLICILPHCNGPYCRASNGCLVCCNN